MNKFKWYRKIIGGVWKKYSWKTLNRTKEEWRHIHNGKWCEYEGEYEIF